MSEILKIDTGTGGSIDTARGSIKKDPNMAKDKLLPLVNENHDILKSPMPKFVGDLTDEFWDTLLHRMWIRMKHTGGIGLSANQVGINERIFIMGNEEICIACINPEVKEQSEEQELMVEGCLSYPGLMLSIRRPKWVIGKFTNAKGETIEQRFEGLSARCYLHELDHMNGIRMIDHVSPFALKRAQDKQAKLLKKVRRKNKNDKRTNS